MPRFSPLVQKDQPKKTIKPETLTLSITGDFLFPAKREVAVSTEFFAPQLRAWERTWLTWMIDVPIKDQCDAKARRIFAYSIQPVVFAAVGLIGHFVTLCCSAFVLLMAYRNIEWRRMLGWGKRREHLVRDLHPSSRFDRWYLWPLAPMTLVATPLSLLLLNWMLAVDTINFIDTWRELYWWSVGLLLCFFAISAIAVLDWTIGNARPVRQKKRQARTPPHYLKVEELLVCETGAKPVTLGAIPSWRRPIRLTFQGLKRERCRPYAQSE